MADGRDRRLLFVDERFILNADNPPMTAERNFVITRRVTHGFNEDKFASPLQYSADYASSYPVKLLTKVN